jgi:hypothetical protein
MNIQLSQLSRKSIMPDTSYTFYVDLSWHLHSLPPLVPFNLWKNINQASRTVNLKNSVLQKNYILISFDCFVSSFQSGQGQQTVEADGPSDVAAGATRVCRRRQRKQV